MNEVKHNKEDRYKVPDTEEERTERAIEELLTKEKNLAIQRYLAPDLT